MSDLYAHARALVRSLRESPEWQRMHRLAGTVRGDSGSEQLLSTFRLRQLEAQALALQGERPGAEAQAALQQLVRQVQAHGTVRPYLEAEQAYGKVLQEVQQILAEVFQPEVPGAVK